MKKTLITIVMFLITFTLVSCDFSDDESPPNKPFDPNENIQEETVLYEDILYEIILNEEIYDEFQLTQIEAIEKQLTEDVILEEIQVEIFLQDDINSLMNNYFVSQIYEYDIDWPMVIGKFAVGTAVIVVTGVVSSLTSSIPPVAFVFGHAFTRSYQTALSAVTIGSLINYALLSNEYGDNKAAIKKYMIEGAADQFMWGAITGALLGGIEGGFKYALNPKVLLDGQAAIISEGTKKIVDGKPIYDIINQYGSVVGKASELTLQTGARAGQTMFLVADGNKWKILDPSGEVTNSFIDASGKEWTLSQLMNAERSKGVRDFWKYEKQLVETTGSGTYDWTTSQITELLTKGKVSGFEVHHINSVSTNPQLAANINNLIPLTKDAHLDIHDGSWRNATSGALTNFTEVLKSAGIPVLSGG